MTKREMKRRFGFWPFSIRWFSGEHKSWSSLYSHYKQCVFGFTRENTLTKMSDSGCTSVFPPEIFVEILSWVPVKDITRMRCVCKSWNSLVSDRSFVNLHLERSARNTYLLYTLYHIFESTCYLHCCPVERLLRDPASTFENGGLPFKMKYNIIVIGVCNGLVCLTDTTIERGFQNVYVRFWNPATRLISDNSPSIRSHILPTRGDVKFGFGYDDSRDIYKVVAVVADRESLETQVRVHCLGDNCWRKVGSWNGYPTLSQDIYYRGQYLSGTLNWVAHRSSDAYIIFSFDLRNETYGYLPLPDEIDIIYCADIGILRGCLYVCLSHYHQGNHFSVWQMKEYGVVDSWVPLLNISCESFQMFKCPRAYRFPLGMSEHGNVLLVASNEDFQVTIYNQTDSKVEHIQLPFKQASMYSTEYVQSLVSPY